MTTIDPEAPAVVDLEPSVQTFRDDVVKDLRRFPKRLQCKYMYDERGSELFDQVCELPEYYPTRTELKIMQRHVQEMAQQLGPGCLLIEYGSGSSMKTRALLDHLEDPAGYVPVEISGDYLQRVAADLNANYPELEVLPVCADFTRPFDVPKPSKKARRSAVYFPGSTIGNFEPDAAEDLLKHMASVVGAGGEVLLGADLKKDPLVLHRAYNDAAGVTAEFNLNFLARINRELDANFDLDRFRHYAFYNPRLGRVEMHLVSLADQTVSIGDVEIDFERGESIHTENSHKHSLSDFAELAGRAGLRRVHTWCDEDKLFSVQLLRAE